MKSEGLVELSNYCDNLFYRCDNSNKLIIFLPSVNGKGIYPYFPRVSWGEELSERYNILYISDPYQEIEIYGESMGSWFVSPEGESTLPLLAKIIEKIICDFGMDDVVFYGSSMGGYASIMLSSLVSGSKAIAECPQIYLKGHPGSRYVVNNILRKDFSPDLIEPINYLKMGVQKHIRIICSAFDHHYSQHISPFIDEIKDADICANMSFSIFFDEKYTKGHVALKKEDAYKVIDQVSAL